MNSHLVKNNIDLINFNTFKVSSLAEYFCSISNKKDLLWISDWIFENKKDFLILGGGSNILPNSKGIKDLILRFNNSDICIQDKLLKVGAGTSLANLIDFFKKNNFTGLEWAFGIPRISLGGAIFQNASSFSQSVSDIVDHVEVFDFDKREFIFLNKVDCNFSYRTSIFQDKSQFLIWNVFLNIKKAKKEDIEKKLKDNLKFRSLRQPHFPNAGSIFKNIDFFYLQKQNKKIAEKFKQKVENNYLSVAVLIEYLGLKGKKIGQAQISEKHANFIVNLGGATSSDIIKLIQEVKKVFKEKLFIELEEEIVYFGF